jgi:hypothetical protein
VPTPSVTPSAQGAVDAYYSYFNADVAASRHPSQADLSFIAKYATGDPRTATQQAFASMKSQGRAWRGTSPDPRVKVKAVLSSTVVQLTSCLMVARGDPWEQYTVATGKALPVPKLTPPPPYLLTIFMKVDDAGIWQIYDLIQTRGATCTG